MARPVQTCCTFDAHMHISAKSGRDVVVVDVGDRWTGRTACLLQAALRLSNDSFARHLGIALRTVAAWHQVQDRTPNTEMQQLLAAALDQCHLA